VTGNATLACMRVEKAYYPTSTGKGVCGSRFKEY
jgi:hypothetical protein